VGHRPPILLYEHASAAEDAIGISPVSGVPRSLHDALQRIGTLGHAGQACAVMC
jgi:hypothetical protein